MNALRHITFIFHLACALVRAAGPPNSTSSVGGLTTVISKPQISQESVPRSSFGKAEPSAKKHYKLADFPEDSAEVAHGLIEGFLQDKELQPGEAQCLQKGTADVAKDVMTVAEHIIMLVQKLLGTRQAVPGLGQFSHVQSKAPPQEAKSAPPPQEAQSSGLFAERRLEESTPGLLMSTSAVIMEFGFSIQKVAALTHQILHTCVHKDGLEAIALATEHAANVEFVSEHIVVDGADVCTELAQGVEHWKQGDRTAVGKDLGAALRKILLAKKIPDAKRPELPATETLLNITNAFLENFFGPGVGIHVKTYSGEDVVDDFHVDLHKCFAQNAHLLESMWADTVFFYERQAKERRDHRLGNDGEKNDFKKALAVNMVQIPSALHKCGLDDDRQQMLKDALKGLGSADGLSFGLTGLTAATDPAVMEQFSRTVQQWKTLGEDGGVLFGAALGKLFQELVVTAFPEKYSADDLGRLQHVAAHANVLIPLLVLLAALMVPAYRKRQCSQVATESELEEIGHLNPEASL